MKSLDAKLAIPMDMAVEFMTQIAKLEGYQQDDAEKLAKQQVQGLSAMGQMFRLTTLKNNTIASSLQYANGQITLNGQKCRWKTLSACLECQRFPYRTFRRCLNNNRLAGCRDAAPGLRRTTRSLYFCVTRRAAIV